MNKSQKLTEGAKIRISAERGPESVLGKGTKVFGTKTRPSKKQSRDDFRVAVKHLIG